MLESGGFVNGKNIPKLGRRNGTTYQHGAIMAEYRTDRGHRVTLRIADGHYTLYNGSLVVTVQPNEAANTSYRWVAVGLVGVRAKVVVAFRDHASACELAKAWAEGLIKMPMIWFIPFDFDRSEPYGEGDINERRGELLANENYRQYVTILPEVERIYANE